MGTQLVDEVRDNARLFFRLSYGILRDEEMARDICQQAYLKAMENRAKGREPSNLRGWLARVVVNESLQIVRRRKIERRALEKHAAMENEPGPGADATVALRESVISAMDALPENVRVVVSLRVMQGMQGNEVKQLLGCGAAEVSRLLHQGLELLRPALADYQV